MELKHHLALTIIVFCFCNGQDDVGSGQADNSVRAIYVKKLLNGSRPLIVLLGNEGQINHPICWWSQKSATLEKGFEHNLTYFRKDNQGRRKHGSWQVRNTTYLVSRKAGSPTIGVKAYYGNGTLDIDVSKVYLILFASPSCFVMSTPQNDSVPLIVVNNDNSRCLLWAPYDTEGTTRRTCEEQFFAQCNNVGVYAYRYRKTVCNEIDNE
ncbi:uncharacterized protein LOC119454432 isoform X2 [Dermacentor silvarum]|uniref:uncharacterized protein LOC119454432 isoform X2 n=1 Tax=Dermacentor silvarum TaxID=543639 RepID=UPI002100840E|nr:uncharacterized protein LOC119454432 isoform X2 [Dermacentor silvarum]